ncbi:hypothetical protein NL676_033361 [Syzygium grande]|nr:hypothetical protein NL676_033361 [Syzygium grande]
MDDPKAPTSAASGPKKPRANKYVLFCTILASTNSILLGYDIGVMSGAVICIRENLKITKVQEQFLVGILNVFSLVGSLASGKTSDLIGRRYTIVLAASTFLIGALLMGLAPSYAVLMVGRVVAGIGVGYSLMIAPLYTAEIAPASVRGMLTSLPEFFIVAGILLGFVCNYAFAGLPEWLNWRIMLGIAAIPAIGLGSSIMFMPESPRWLVMKGRIEEAKRVLLKTSRDEEEAALKLHEITQAAQDDADLASSNGWSGQGVWKEFLHPSPALRRILITAIGINFFMQASGNDAVIYYTPEVFKAAGIHNKRKLFGINVIMGTSKAAFVMVSALFLDRFGRRPLLLLGTVARAIKEELLKVNKEEGSAPAEWRAAMVRSFHKMDKEVIAWNEGMVAVHTRCSRELHSPKYDVYGKDGGGGVGVAAFEPSSVCSVKMVQHFIEESNEQQLGTKCSRNHCNCVNGNNNDSFADKLDMFDCFIESVTNGLSSYALDALKVKAARGGEAEKRASGAVNRAFGGAVEDIEKEPCAAKNQEKNMQSISNSDARNHHQQQSQSPPATSSKCHRCRETPSPPPSPTPPMTRPTDSRSVTLDKNPPDNSKAITAVDK